MLSWSGTGEVYIEDISGNQIAYVATFSISDLKPHGISGWAYRVPLTVTAESDMKDKITNVEIDFALILEELGIANMTFDQNSVRVPEFDVNGEFIGEKQAKANFRTDTMAEVLWLIDGVTPAGTTRYFYIYFDITENGIKEPSQNTDFSDAYNLTAFSDDTGYVYVTESRGDSTFSTVQVDNVITSNFARKRGIVIDDFDNDGFMDLVTGYGLTGELFFHRNVGDGTNTFFPLETISTINANYYIMDMAAADFNNDGNKDFVVSGNSNLLYLFSGEGNGLFVQSTIPSPTGSDKFRGKTAEDTDGDGNIDLIVGDLYGGIYIYKSNGDTTFEPARQVVDIGTEPYGVVAGDFDGDEVIDIIANSGGSGDAYLIKGNEDGTFGAPSYVPTLDTNYYTAFDKGDFNNDGNLDVVAATYFGKTIELYTGNGDGTFEPGVAIATTESYVLGISSSPQLPKVQPVLGVSELMPSMFFNFIWNTGNTPPENYKVHVTLSENAGIVTEDYASFEILPDIVVDSSIVTDKISYTVNETATITSTITSLSENTILENLSAIVTVADSLGTALYTETNAIPILLPGQMKTFNTYWNTSTNPSGNYPVILEVKDSAGTVLSTSTKNLTISSTVDPSKLLIGQISVDKQSLLQGDNVNIDYSVTNVGNIDLSQVDLSIPIVHVVELTPYNTLTDQTALLMGDTYTNTQPQDTQTYSAKDYLVILRASISGNEETLASTYFRVEGMPSAPSLNRPAHAEDIETLTPELIVNNASDPNDDDLTYEFELYTDNTLSNLLSSSDMIAEGEGTTLWQVPLELVENEVYYWRARAYDGLLYGDWMTPAEFRVNLINDPPTAPTLSSPADSSEVDTFTPDLIVNNASDPDSDNLTYNFELALDMDFTQIISSEIGIFEGDGTTSWQAPVSLSENTYYYWRAQADDWLTEGPWMTTAGFFVNTANDAPTAPIIISPLNDSEITTLSADIIASNSTDPDNDPLIYVFEIDTVNTFDSPDMINSGSIFEGAGTTSWYADGLTDNTYYYVRAKASDGLAESPWSEVTGFFVNTVNDAPTRPVLANPSDGGAVNVFNPELSVHNSSDIDLDVLTYEFEIYEDEAMTVLIASASGVEETPDITSWTVSVNLIENNTYFWRARAFDGELLSGWMPLASFMVNTANDAPGAPSLNLPADGSTVDTLNPALSVYNAVDPDSDFLSYDFEIYSEGTPIQTITGIPEDISGTTSITLAEALSDNTIYRWRVKAYDGDRYGAWMTMAEFSVHLPVLNITGTIDFDPNTLNKKSKGKWVVVYIELPEGYDVADIVVSSVIFEGVIPAEPWPYNVGDEDNDGIPDLMVKFKRADVVAILPNGDNVIVNVTGTVGAVTFEGFDIIRVIN